MIEKWILPHLSKGKRGFKPKISMTKVVLLILKRMKTGCQWRELCIKEHFNEGEVSWQNIYKYFNKWSKDGSFKKVWVNLLSMNKHHLDLSSVQIDGSHTPAKRGGEAVGYQGRKATKTTNSIFLSDNTGQMLSVSVAQSGEHNDLYNIKTILEELLETLEAAGIGSRGVFLNADPGFDSEELQASCNEKEIELNVKENKRNKKKDNDEYRYFDEELYKRRTKIEHANAWMDAFKALLVRYEQLIVTWMSLQWLAFITLFCRKLKV
jgi:transposase